jgi:hypothetical protein
MEIDKLSNEQSKIKQSEQTQNNQLNQSSQQELISDEVTLDSDTGVVSAMCPHCLNIVIIEQLNCCIFRHGIYKDNYNQIPPHLPKQQCDDLKNKDLIFGCGKPFQVVKDNSDPTNIEKMKIVVCDYI